MPSADAQSAGNLLDDILSGTENPNRAAEAA